MDAKPFTDTLGELDDGKVLAELTAKLHQITRQAMEIRKGGSLTLKLDVRPSGKTTVALAWDIKAKVPEETKLATTFFVDEAGTLTRHDPNQPRLPLREIARDHQAPPRDVDDDQPRRPLRQVAD